MNKVADYMYSLCYFTCEPVGEIEAQIFVVALCFSIKMLTYNVAAPVSR